METEIASGRLVHCPLHGGGAMATEFCAYLRHGRTPPAALAVFIGLLRDEFSAREKGA